MISYFQAKEEEKMLGSLGRVTDFCALINQTIDSRCNKSVFGIVPFGQLKERVAVQQVGNRHDLIVIPVDHLAGESLARHGRDFVGVNSELVEPGMKLLPR